MPCSSPLGKIKIQTHTHTHTHSHSHSHTQFFLYLVIFLPKTAHSSRKRQYLEYICNILVKQDRVV